MNINFPRHAKLALKAVALGVAFFSQAHAAAVKLDPLFLTSPVAVASGGLAGTWYKVQNDAQFSEAQWEGSTIKNSSWGTGIWAMSDVNTIAANPSLGYVTSSAKSVGAVSYANNIYNNTFSSGAYGTWGTDYSRALNPIVGASNACDTDSQLDASCSKEQNYLAIFTGYLYVAQQGFYDFGVFADDIFNFSLTGLNGMYGMSKDAVAGSPGRTLDYLLAKNNFDSLELSQGFYGVGLSYANRLEAGVVDLGWKGPGNTEWRTINESDLFNKVPEPSTYALLALGLIGLWVSRKRAKPSNSLNQSLAM